MFNECVLLCGLICAVVGRRSGETCCSSSERGLSKKNIMDSVPETTALQRALLTARSGRAIVDFVGPSPSEFAGLSRLCRGLRRLHAVAPPRSLMLAHLSARWISNAVNALVARAAANWPGLSTIDLAGFRGLTDASLLVVAERCPQLMTLNVR